MAWACRYLRYRRAFVLFALPPVTLIRYYTLFRQIVNTHCNVDITDTACYTTVVERGYLAMAKVVTKARQLRMNMAAKLGRPVTIEEVAAATGIARPTLSRIELNQTERIDFETIRKLCEFYGVGAGELIVVQPDDKQRPVPAYA